MALHWQHIKGVYKENNQTNPIYSYIEFAGTNTPPSLYTSTNNSANRNTITGNPNLYKNLGKIITSNAENQTIDQEMKFNKGVKLYQNTNGSNFIQFFKDQNSTAAALSITFDADKNATRFRGPQYTFTTIGVNIAPQDVMSIKKERIKLTAPVYISPTCSLIIDDPDSSSQNTNATKVSANFVQAPYFNATSDKRAKENIMPFQDNALEIIKKIRTYTFNYKDTPTTSYGIMAQDLVDTKINDFSFVENIAATGEGNDYMSIRETKLIYLLIEGMKEQQMQIEQLRKELEVLKNGK